MIKIKVHPGTWGRRRYDNISIPICDYTYCVYLFGFLVHTLVIKGIEYDVAEEMFGDKIVEIVETEDEDE